MVTETDSIYFQEPALEMDAIIMPQTVCIVCMAKEPYIYEGFLENFYAYAINVWRFNISPSSQK
jgi:hypothetical protein